MHLVRSRDEDCRASDKCDGVADDDDEEEDEEEEDEEGDDAQICGGENGVIAARIRARTFGKCNPRFVM